MFLKIVDIVSSLGVDEKTVLGWIKKKGLAAHLVNGRYQVNQVDLLEWATNNGIKIPPRMFAVPEMEDRLPLLSGALARGGIHFDVPGDDLQSALKNVVERLPLQPHMDPDFLYQTLLAREALGSTAIGNGIAIPHVRNPILSQTQDPAVSLCFLKKPIDFKALDDKPVHILFTLITPNVKVHLHMLARLSFMLHEQRFMDLLNSTPGKDEIIAMVTELEERIRR
jgi:Phosphotransferase system mannitol/fructose-specific IIA domain (Ntr-type)